MRATAGRREFSHETWSFGESDFRQGLDLVDAGSAPSCTGLVSLAPPYAFPTALVGGPNLFGQGAELCVERFEVRTDRISGA